MVMAGVSLQPGESIIRETWPGVTDVPAAAGLAHTLMRTFVLAPLAWLLLAPLYFKKVLPVVGKRYTLTNRRVMIRRGWKKTPTHEVALGEIETVRIRDGSLNSFYRTADLEVIAKGQVALLLTAVSEPEGFRRAILNASASWGRRLATVG
jgi:hypothetical protein